MACSIIVLLFARSDRPHDSIPTNSVHQGSTITVAFATARPDSLCFGSKGRLGLSCRTGRVGTVPSGLATTGSTSPAVSARVSLPRQNVAFDAGPNGVPSAGLAFVIWAQATG